MSSLSPDKRKRPKPRPVQSVAQPVGSSSSRHSRLSSGLTLKDKGKQEYQSSRSSRDSTPDFEGASQMWNALGSLRPATATTSPMAEGSTSTPAPVAHQSVTDSRPKIGSRRKVVARKSTGGGPLFRPKSTQSKSHVMFLIFFCSLFCQVRKGYILHHQLQLHRNVSKRH